MFGKTDTKTDIPRPSTPPRTENRPASRNTDSNTITAYLGADTHVEGTLRFDHSVLIEGTFKGSIESKGQLVIGEGAEVDADIESRTVTIKGSVRGTINASERIQIQNNATVIGDITTPSLQMDETVTFEGKCSMTGGAKAARRREDERREHEQSEKAKDNIIDAVATVKS